MPRHKKTNLLILGASGGVATAMLIYLAHHRELFNRIILLDKRKEFLSNKFINHQKLDYLFINENIILPENEAEYDRLLKDHKVDITLDLTDSDCLPLFTATDKAGVSYVNTSINGPRRTHIHALEIWAGRARFKSAAHILCTGMNPGIVNIWTKHGIEKYGVPETVDIFEYDSSQIAAKNRLMVTWSVRKFLEEAADEPSVVMAGRDKVMEMLTNAIENRVNMKEILAPILKLQVYPDGFIVSHEEVISLAQKYDVPTRFIYAINKKTMQTMISLHKKKKKLLVNDMLLGDNMGHSLTGADNIGVLLEYKDKKVYYFNSISNIAVEGTNATYTQVATGVIAALFALIFDKLAKGTYFVEDLLIPLLKAMCSTRCRFKNTCLRKREIS